MIFHDFTQHARPLGTTTHDGALARSHTRTTSLTLGYLEYRSDNAYSISVGPLSRPVQLELLECQSDAAYQDHHFRFHDAFVVVFSLCSEASLNEAASMFDAIRFARAAPCLDLPWFLVGTHSDLEGERRVTAERAREIALRNRAGYCETSAKSGANALDAFERLADHISALRSKASFANACIMGDTGTVGSFLATLDDSVDYNRVRKLSISCARARSLFSVSSNQAPLSCHGASVLGRSLHGCRVFDWHSKSCITPRPTCLCNRASDL